MKAGRFERLELDVKELDEILERARTTPLSEEEHRKLKAAMETLVFVTGELEKKGTSIKRLRKLLFGASTEKTRDVLDQVSKSGDAEATTAAAARDREKEKPAPAEGGGGKKKPKGHGRNGAAAYTGAENVTAPHESLKPGDSCPICINGKLYPLPPAVLVRVKGQAPLCAKVFELERLRCNPCGEVFTARTPEGVGEKKYDETAGAMIAVLKYGTGLPFNRLEKLEGSFGIPLPSSTQWEIVLAIAKSIEAAFVELVRQGAQGEVMHNDDTTAKILALMGKRREHEAPKDDPPDRTGIFTSGIVSVHNGRRIALFFTGRKHAGENLAQVLAQRASESGPLIQMCDGLARNVPKNLPPELKTILCNCLSHGRRQFVDVAEDFPSECLHVLDELGKVYGNDAIARAQGMTPTERLSFHRAESRKVMDDLEQWMTSQLEEKKVEPNSQLGEAISYMLKRWKKLTRFLTVRGAPIDNNVVERALKKAILHRRNSLFYRSQRGADVGDLFMSLIHTAELCGADPFDYLVTLQRFAEQVAEAPSAWMPWNYQETRASLADAAFPAP